MENTSSHSSQEVVNKRSETRLSAQSESGQQVVRNYYFWLVGKCRSEIPPFKGGDLLLPGFFSDHPMLGAI